MEGLAAKMWDTCKALLWKCETVEGPAAKMGNMEGPAAKCETHGGPCCENVKHMKGPTAKNVRHMEGPEAKMWDTVGSFCQNVRRMDGSTAKIWDTWRQCCGSGMFIPDPRSWFLPIPDPGSRTPDLGSKNSNKREGWKFFFYIPFFGHKFHKIENYFIF